MSSLPVIVGLGGVNPAGRSSSFHSYRRMVAPALPAAQAEETALALALLMGLAKYDGQGITAADGGRIAQGAVGERLGRQMEQGTYIRKVSLFDPDQVPFRKKIELSAAEGGFSAVLAKRSLPDHLPSGVTVEDLGEGKVRLSSSQPLQVYIEDFRPQLACSAGQLPDGFDPGAGYNSNSHPRGLKLAVYGASDCLGFSGLDWDFLQTQVSADQIGVYASAAMGQLDEEGLGGYMKSALQGKRTSTKQMPLSLAEMPGDFLNAYVLGSLGHTGGLLGACATFLYNLEHAMKDIQSGRRRIAMVGAAEAPLVPEVFEGYRVMSALAEDDQILALDKDKGINHVRHSHACRPFGLNCGFTLAEASEFVILMDESLALEVGAQIFGAVGGVFIHADGYKKSISGPGAGNYLTFARAAGLVQSMLGAQALTQHSFVSAHGTGTPQNRVTESHVLNEVAKAFGIASLPVAAVKCYLGHSVGCAAGSQIMASLGTFHHGILPGIFTLDAPAPDVHRSNLALSQTHVSRAPKDWQTALINSKGFGGNNATAVLLSPQVSREMIAKRHGQQAMADWQKKLEATQARAQEFERQTLLGQAKPRYHFGEQVIEDSQIQITRHEVRLPGQAKPVSLDLENPFPDMTP